MSVKFVIPARMEPSVLTLLVVTAASVLQTSRENIVTKVTEEAGSLKEVICMISKLISICCGRMKTMEKYQRLWKLFS